jgi:hypothetical protein
MFVSIKRLAHVLHCLCRGRSVYDGSAWGRRCQVRRPDVLTRVSEYIPEIVEYTQGIINKGYGYAVPLADHRSIAGQARTVGETLVGDS